MLVTATRNVPARFRGFLASCMLEVAPGIYLSPRLNKAVRERVWAVMTDWWSLAGEDAALVMIWRDALQPSGVSLRMLGAPALELVELDGLWLTRRPLSGEDQKRLAAFAGRGTFGFGASEKASTEPV